MSVLEGFPSQTQTEQPQDALPVAVPAETFAAPQELVASFETSQGSVYSYNEAGQTTRSKKATGEQIAPQDLTVFADLTLDQEQDVLEAYRTKGSSKVYVVERQPDDSPKIVRSVGEVQQPDRLYLSIFRDGVMSENLPASLFPRTGANVFDTRHFQQDGTWMTERHLGHKVTKINYKEPASTALAS